MEQEGGGREGKREIKWDKNGRDGENEENKG